MIEPYCECGKELERIGGVCFDCLAKPATCQECTTKDAEIAALTSLREEDIRVFQERIAELEAVIDTITTPRLWSKEMDRAWHKSIPDVPLAFHELKKAAIKRAKIK